MMVAPNFRSNPLARISSMAWLPVFTAMYTYVYTDHKVSSENQHYFLLKKKPPKNKKKIQVTVNKRQFNPSASVSPASLPFPRPLFHA